MQQVITNIILALWLATDALRILVYLQVGETDFADTLLCAAYLYLAWSVLKRSQPVHKLESPYAYALVISSMALPLLFLLLPFTSPLSSDPLDYILRLTSAALLTWSALILGRNFSVMPHARRLVASGPYRFLRHPIYTAYLVYDLSICLSAGNVWFFLVWAVEIALFIERTRMEEETLIGASLEYTAYKARTKYKLLPGLY